MPLFNDFDPDEDSASLEHFCSFEDAFEKCYRITHSEEQDAARQDKAELFGITTLGPVLSVPARDPSRMVRIYIEAAMVVVKQQKWTREQMYKARNR
jgi:hypothetical protein